MKIALWLFWIILFGRLLQSLIEGLVGHFKHRKEIKYYNDTMKIPK